MLLGHSEIFSDINPLIENAVRELIIEKNTNVFYAGGMGDFDTISAHTVNKLKKEYPYIKLVLVLPYFSNKINRYKTYYEEIYNDIIIPQEIIGSHYKNAILNRNKWIINNSNFIISYTYKNFGGAYQAIRYAEKQGKYIINLYNKNNK